MDLWYTCDALVDFDGLVDLFGWTWALIITYCDGCVMGGWMCGWMRYICDGWDIYVMDEIYVCMNLFVMMECKKKLKIAVLGHFAECCTRQRTLLPSAVTMALDNGVLCRVQHSAKWPKTAIFDFFLHSIMTNKFIQTYITDISHPSHIYLIHPHIHPHISHPSQYISHI